MTPGSPHSAPATLPSSLTPLSRVSEGGVGFPHQGLRLFILGASLSVSLLDSLLRRDPLESPPRCGLCLLTLASSLVPEVFKEAQSCLWKAWDVFCGLEPQPGPKLAPKEAAVEKMERGTTSGGIKHSVTSEGTEHSATSEGTEHSATSEGTAHSAKWEGTKRCDTSQTPFWRKVANISAFFLIAIVILCHIYYS